MAKSSTRISTCLDTLYVGLMLRRKIAMPESMIAPLRDYPTDMGTRAIGDAIILSSFVSFKAAFNTEHPRELEQRAAWARSFWTQNWHNFPCLPEEELGDSSSNNESS